MAYTTRCACASCNTPLDITVTEEGISGAGFTRITVADDANVTDDTLTLDEYIPVDLAPDEHVVAYIECDACTTNRPET